MQTITKQITVLCLGIAFGIILTKSEVITWARIDSMFRFEEAYMYLVISSAVIVGAISVWLIKQFKLTTIYGEAVTIKEKPFQKGIVLGGILFGLGWAITGACPGPIYSQIGTGEWLALLTFAGAMAGAYLYAYLRPLLPH